MKNPRFSSAAMPADVPVADPPADALQEGEGGVETITAENARDAMTRNTRNRTIRWTKVREYARDMAAGHWRVNGETFKIATDDQVIDGQHRYLGLLQAAAPGTVFRTIADALVAEASKDMAIRAWVIRGLPPDTQDTIDIGLHRKLSDQLAMHDYDNPQNLATITQWAYRWVRGVRRGGGTEYKPTHAEQMAFIRAEPRLMEAAQFAADARKDFVNIRPGVWGMAWLVFTGINDVEAKVFLTQVRDGADIGRGNPAHTLRERFIKAKGPFGERLTEHEELALMISAWNAFREERQIFKLPLPTGGLTSKNFPVPK